MLLTIPAKPDYVALSRLIIAALGSRSELEREAVADLKVAVTEACATFIPSRAAAGPAGAIEILFDVYADHWVVTVVGDEAPPVAEPLPGSAGLEVAAADAGPGSAEAGHFSAEPGAVEEGLGLAIIGALVDMVAREPRDGKWALTMVKRLP